MNKQEYNKTYKKIEEMLYNYPKVKAEIENIKLDIEEMEDIVGIRGVSDNLKGSTPTYAFNSSVENEVINREEKLPERIEGLCRVLRSKERFIRKVDNALETLNENSKQLVQLKYFKKYTIERVAEVMDVSTSTVIRGKKEVVAELINVL